MGETIDAFKQLGALLQPQFDDCERFIADFSMSSIDGYCPVQAYGTINGQSWYYRSRHDCWRIEVGRQTIAEGEDSHSGWGRLDEHLEVVFRELLAWARRNDRKPADAKAEL